MLFDDDISYIDNAVEKMPICIAKPVNMKTHFFLKDLWIPSELLINRKKALDSNRNRPNIFHTLYKPDAESFSVYFKDSEESTENENLQAFELRKSYEYENNLSCVSNTDQTNSPKPCFSNEDENSEQELKLFLELLNESSTNEIKAELENLMDPIHLEKQNEVDNRKQCEQVLDAFNSESPITIENETECQVNEKAEIFLHSLNSKCLLCKDKTLGSVCHNKEKLEKLDAVNVEKQNLGENSDDTVNMEKMCDDSLSGCSSQAVTELPFLTDFPVAYQKHSFQDPPTRQKNHKEKKKKNAVKKSIQLGDFLQTVNSDGYEIPKRDEFYDNLVRQGICAPQDPPEREVYGSPSQYSFVTDFPEENTSLLSNNDCAVSLFESVENIQSCGVEELEDDESLTTTLVLENISCKVDKECIESLMSAYGKLKNISFEDCEKSYKAYVKLVVEHEVEWVIDCLDGNEPFGASHGLLKCYELQE